MVWSNDWQMKFNSNKCKILHVGENNPAVLYYMDANELESTGLEKDLGVQYSPLIANLRGMGFLYAI